MTKIKISIKNYCKQLPVPFKIYADFECILRGVKSSDKNNGSYTEKYQDHISFSFANKVACTDNKLSKIVVHYRGKSAAYRFIEVKKHFNKNFFLSAEERNISIK